VSDKSCGIIEQACSCIRAVHSAGVSKLDITWTKFSSDGCGRGRHVRVGDILAIRT
jgi:hypothetical protein